MSCTKAELEALNAVVDGNQKQAFPEKNRMQIEKVIYASRNPKTKEQVTEILELEIATHLRNHPDLKFKDLSKPTHNSDRSMTYTIHFEKA